MVKERVNMFDILANFDHSTIQHIFSSNLANFGHLSFTASLGQSIIRSKFHVPAPHFPLLAISQLRQQPILLFFLRKIFQLTWNCIEMIIWWRREAAAAARSVETTPEKRKWEKSWRIKVFFVVRWKKLELVRGSIFGLWAFICCKLRAQASFR